MRRVFATHHGPDHPNASGPSWLTCFAQATDSVCSVDLFRCESIPLRSRWVLVAIDGPAICRMFNQAMAVRRRRGFALPVTTQQR